MEDKTQFEDNELRSLFAGFNPPMSSDAHFLDRLQTSLKAVESARAELAAMRRSNRRAVIIAAFAGFIMGVIATLAMPHLLSLASGFAASLPAGIVTGALADNLPIIAWVLTAAIIVFTALNTYDLSLRLLTPNRE